MPSCLAIFAHPDDAEIARQVTEMDANIEAINIQEKGAHHGVMHLALQVHNRIHLANIMRRIRTLSFVIRVNRSKN